MSIRTKRNSRRFIAAAAAVAVAVSTFATSSPLSAAPVVTENTRIAGADRYATANAVAVAKVGLARNANYVVLVSGENFPDGLAAASLAGAFDAPMLLTQSASMPTSVLTALTTITSLATGTKNVVIVGGTSAVSADVQAQLTATGYTVTRISGADRYATADAVAAATRTNNTGTAIGTFGASNLRTAFLASGTNFPDALAASAVAYAGGHPIFLTNGTTLTDETKAAMIAAGVQQVLILGGTTAVSPEVATAVAGVTGVIASSRIGGANRYETATALATAAGAAAASFKSRAYLVSGTDFPDALVAAQLAGGTNSGAIIPVTSPLPAAISTWVTANQATLANIQAIGGTTAVPAEIVTAVKTGATTAPLSATITAVDGAGTFSVVFSAAVSDANSGTGATNPANYRVTSALGSSKVVASASYTALTRTAVVTVTGGLSAGDTIQVMPNSIVSSVTGSLFVAAATATVVADTSAPTITIVAYPTTVGAVPSDPSATGRVWVTLSSNARIVNDAHIESRLNLMSFRGVTLGAVPTVFSSFDRVDGTNTFVGNYSTAVAGGFITGGTVALAAGTVTSSASTPVASAATSAVITADVTAPSITSATFTQSGTAVGTVQASIGVADGLVTVSAKVGTSAAGKAGNLVKLATVSLSAAAAPAGGVSCVFSSTTNTVTISAAGTAVNGGASTVSALAVANACNTVAGFNALFVASVHGDGGALGASFVATAATLMAGGRDLVTLTITTSEPINPQRNSGLVSSLGFTGVVGSTANSTGVAVEVGLNTSAVQHLAGAVTMTVTTDGTFTDGLSTVAVPATTVFDRAGNAMATTAVVIRAAS